MSIDGKIVLSANISVLFAILLLIFSGIPITGRTSVLQYQTAKPIIIDTDGAPDDVYAVLYLLNHPDYDVKGLTLSPGVAYVDVGAQNFVELLSYLGYHAVEIVFAFELPTLLVPLDATNKVPITQAFKDRLGMDLNTPEAVIIHGFLTVDLFFWDILAVVALTNREIVTVQEFHLEVLINTTNKEGSVVPSESGFLITEVAIDADRQAFEDQFLAVVNPCKTITSSETESSESKSSITITIFVTGLFILVSLNYRKKYTHT